jgi:hypothetical protein
MDIRKIKPLRVGKGQGKPVKGRSIIEQLESSIFLSGKTGSGKTTVLAHLLKPRILLDKRTTVVIWASTVNIDPAWKTIVRRLKKAGIPVMTFTEVIDDDGVNTLQNFLEVIQSGLDKDDEEGAEQPAEILPESTSFCRFDCAEPRSSEEKKGKETKEVQKERVKVYKDTVPEYILVFDDLDIKTLRSDYMVNLVKKSRHFHAKIFISGQMISQLTPSAYNQLSYLYLFGGFSKPNIKTIHERMKTSLDFEEFWELYKRETDKKYSWLNINMRSGEIKEKFGKILS